MTETERAVADPERPVSVEQVVEAHDVEEAALGSERKLEGLTHWLVFALGTLYVAVHIYILNLLPIETWTYRIGHVAGGLVLGFLLFNAWAIDPDRPDRRMGRSEWVPLAIGALTGGYAFLCVLYAAAVGFAAVPAWLFQPVDLGFAETSLFGVALTLSVAIGIVSGWVSSGSGRQIPWYDWLLALAAITVAAYLIPQLARIRMSAGTPFAQPPDFWATFAGVLLILELTRRAAGLALVIIAGVFVAYGFMGPLFERGTLLYHQGYTLQRFFTYIYTDNGILGAPVAVSSTYIMIFIVFAAILQASGVGNYFVNFAFAVAGRARGGPAKVAVFSSGLMGMINGTSAGNVVATGSLTIPLMQRVGYRRRVAGAIEATASTGGQLMPPIMGAGAFIMAEITGIPYQDIVIAAIIPAILYFGSVYFNVDLEAVRTGMRGMKREELPLFKEMLKQAYLFIPIIILIVALFGGYSVIRAGTYAMIAAVVVSWLTPHRMGPWRIIQALDLSARMALQIIVVCACAGIIVGVISLTGVGGRFASLLLGVANSPFLPPEIGHLLAMVFAMCIAIILGMGMPTTAAYAVAASVVAPGLVQLGVPPLIAHFFVFYFAVISAITPPVALASYAAAGISGASPMWTSVVSFKFGLAAFIVPYMFFYNPGMLIYTYVEGERVVAPFIDIAHVFITASIGIYLLSASVQGWFLGRVGWLFRTVLLVGALMLISGGWMTDLLGLAIAIAVAAYQKIVVGGGPDGPRRPATPTAG